MKGLTQEQLNWIYKQDWFPKYCTNIIKEGEEYKWANFKSGEANPEHLIFTAFTWGLTPEGSFYWVKIDQKWRVL